MNKMNEKVLSEKVLSERLLSQIDKLQLSERAAGLRKAFFDTLPTVHGERSKFAMQGWKESDGWPIDLRRARIMKRILEGIPTPILPGQLLAGSETLSIHGAYPHEDYDGGFLGVLMEEQDDAIRLGTPVAAGRVTKEDWKILGQSAQCFRGRVAQDLADEAVNKVTDNWYKNVVEARGTVPTFSPPIGVVDYRDILAKGVGAYIREVEAYCEGHYEGLGQDDPSKLYFWQATRVALEALINYAKRFARTARDAAKEEKDGKRKEELQEIADACDQVPERPARTFFEACQCIALVSVALKLENEQAAPSIGHLDQLLDPYLRADLANGAVTIEKAAELVADLIAHFGRWEWVQEVLMSEMLQAPAVTNCTIAGQTSDGGDACSETTYLILHVAGLVKYAEPHISFRWHKNIPRRFLLKALETNRAIRGGIPQFQNSDRVIDYLMERGITVEDARSWMAQGCSQAVVPSQPNFMWPTYINVPLALDLMLHNGVAPRTGKKIGIETGDPVTFKTWEEFWKAFQKQYDFFARQIIKSRRLMYNVIRQHWRVPVASALVSSCRKYGKSHLDGGYGDYPLWFVKDRGIVDTADSLTVIKKLVYDERKLTMREALEALDADFEGERGGEIRRMFMAVTKFGNDDDDADKMVQDVSRFSASVITSEKNVFGRPFTINRNGMSWHYFGGKGVGALPNGRKQGQPLADGSLSPALGADRSGPTAVLRSATKVDIGKDCEFAILNLKFSGNLMQSQENLDKIASLTNAFMKSGGTYIQYNMIDRDTLLEAKKHPEMYKDLIVRVAGYSAYFTYLTPEVQDEIIARTEQSVF